jgi:hypothetical protein
VWDPPLPVLVEVVVVADAAVVLLLALLEVLLDGVGLVYSSDQVSDVRLRNMDCWFVALLSFLAEVEVA